MDTAPEGFLCESGLLPRHPRSTWVVLVLTFVFVALGLIGTGEHVRLPRENHPARAKRDWKVSFICFTHIPTPSKGSDLLTAQTIALYRSCILHRFVKNEWRVLSSQTIGVEFASKIIKVGTGSRRKRIKLQVSKHSGDLGAKGHQNI